MKTPNVFRTIMVSSLCLALYAGAAWAGGEGTSGAPFLKIGTSARAEGLGGAYTALVNDVDATNWNPAGLTQLKHSSIGLTHLEWFEGIRYEYLAYADKLEGFGAFGVGLGYLYLGDIPRTLETATGDFDAANSGGTFGASDMLLDFGWGGSLGIREHKIGVGVKIIQESIAENQGFSIGLDAGDQFLISKTKWYKKLEADSWAAHVIPSTIAVALKNIGTPVKFFNQNDPLPFSANFGLAYGFLDDDLNFGLDFSYLAVESATVVHAGAEYWLHAGNPDSSFDVAVRGGYRTGYASTTAPGFSVGGSLRYSALGLDYVFMPFGDLGTTHRISLKFSWGDVLKDRVRHRRAKGPKNATTGAPEEAYQETVDKMMEQKKTMEGKVVVQKTVEAGANQTTVEAKKPENAAVAKETKSLGADVNAPAKGSAEIAASGVKISPNAIIKGSPTKMDNDLIAKITQSKEGQNSRTQTQYTRRTQEDVARAARREAELQSQAIDDVESAAKEEATQRGGSAAGEQGKLVTKTTVYFAANSGQLNDRYLFALDKIAFAFDQFPQRTILVHGYTSADEGDKKKLSLKRAEAVKDYLVQIKSIPANKISVKGFGDSEPAAANNNESNRAKNRRVRIQLIKAGN